MTRVVCDFLHDANSARSRNRMRQSYAKVVPSKSAFDCFFVKVEKREWGLISRGKVIL